MMRAETKLRSNFDEGAGRLSLLARVVTGMGAAGARALDIDRAGVALFLTALATRSGQSRTAAVLSTNNRQTARLALGLRAAGLSGEDAERQVLRINPQAEPPAEAVTIDPDDARRLIADTPLTEVD
tara:strand:- start:653 stop:1033 length:381 start_codon:yes stop_codon:yes gene_type:complete